MEKGGDENLKGREGKGKEGKGKEGKWKERGCQEKKKKKEEKGRRGSKPRKGVRDHMCTIPWCIIMFVQNIKESGYCLCAMVYLIRSGYCLYVMVMGIEKEKRIGFAYVMKKCFAEGVGLFFKKKSGRPSQTHSKSSLFSGSSSVSGSSMSSSRILSL